MRYTKYRKSEGTMVQDQQQSILPGVFSVILKDMLRNHVQHISIENHVIDSIYLQREVIVDCYLPLHMAAPSPLSLLLINDGQDLVKMKFEKILEQLYLHNEITPLLCVGMHCGTDRRNEYATAKVPDYKGRGAKAQQHTDFVMKELIPFIRKTYHIQSFKEKSFAGFSLGALSALDIVWSHPAEFVKMGAFSGSFWWRDKAQEDEDFDEAIHRIMHRQVRQGSFHPWLKFFFEVGTLDETADRNNNGIIDAIDDTVSLIDELKKKGYSNKDIEYLELKDGKHDVPTWARAFPAFLKWGWGNTIKHQ